MASESVTVKFVVADQAGHKVAYTDTGKLNSTHPVIILIPGIGDLRSQYRFLSPRFEKHHRVLTIDLRGLGDSDVGFDGYAPHQVGADIVQLIAKEKITASQGVILVGNSMGAAASEWHVF
jgi:pimeloyl-ACP methyl ester carboxylesterase